MTRPSRRRPLATALALGALALTLPSPALASAEEDVAINATLDAVRKLKFEGYGKQRTLEAARITARSNFYVGNSVFEPDFRGAVERKKARKARLVPAQVGEPLWIAANEMLEGGPPELRLLVQIEWQEAEVDEALDAVGPRRSAVSQLESRLADIRGSGSLAEQLLELQIEAARAQLADAERTLEIAEDSLAYLLKSAYPWTIEVREGESLKARTNREGTRVKVEGKIRLEASRGSGETVRGVYRIKGVGDVLPPRTPGNGRQP